MKTRFDRHLKKALAFVLLFFMAGNVCATDIYGYMSGNGNPADIKVGMYKFDSKTLERTSITDLMASFWGGAFAEDKYYFLFSSDYPGYVPEGLYSFNIDTGKIRAEFKSITSQCCDLTYDHSTSTMYGVKINEAGEKVPHTLIKIDLMSGAVTEIAQMSVKIAALACNFWGDMYAMGCDGNLYLLDQTNGDLTFVASSGFLTDISQLQSMDFDRETGDLYWTFLDSEEDAHFTVLDVTAENIVKEDHIMPDNALYVGLYAKAPEIDFMAPGNPANLTASGKECNVTLSWTNPTKTFDGDPLSLITKVEVLRNNKVVFSTENAKPGDNMTWTDTEKVEKTVAATRYVVRVYNKHGHGDGASVSIMLGSDIPALVTEFTVTPEGNNAVLSWKAPEKGKRGGELDSDKLYYRIRRLPDNVIFDNIKENSFVDSTITLTANYTYQISCGNEVALGNYLTSERVTIGNPLTAPYSTDFSSELLAAQWTVFDNNSDYVTWQWKDNAYVYPFSYSNDGDDDLVSVPFHFMAGKEYTVKYVISAPSLFSSPEHFTISLGDTVLEDLDGYNNESPEERVIDFTVPEDGYYTFKLSALSPGDNWKIEISSLSVDVKVDTDLAVTDVKGEEDLVAGNEAAFTAVFANKGTKPVNSFSFVVTDDLGNKQEFTAGEGAIMPSETREEQFTWAAAEGSKYITVTCSAEGDDITADNTYRKDLYVIDADEYFFDTEKGENHPNLLPFSFEGHSFSFAQTIYRQNELNIKQGELIRGISYEYKNKGESLYDKHVKVYVSNSETGKMQDGYADSNDMTLVFDGNVDFINGSHRLHLQFDVPFEYTGKNLRVTTEKLDDASFAYVQFNAKKFDDFRTAIYFSEAYEVNLEEVQGSTMLNEARFRVQTTDTGISDAQNDECCVRYADNTVYAGICADEIAVYTVSGMLVSKTAATDRVNVSALAEGAYIVKVQHGSDTTVAKVLVRR